ncbi:hypothetical protein CDEST_00058 [Colletotrichum destructivum]|uniref:Uncharacterized protein n=1 Tax=Colletotrichum destructivum TaxID=34406 RepID=A0AAX4HW01_9PEZI|nr:hypothetical protein CDEST_00058 [Colletotrichum destructivum]
MPNLSVVHSAHNCTEAIVCTCETLPYVVPVRKQVLSVDRGEPWRSMPATPPGRAAHHRHRSTLPEPEKGFDSEPDCWSGHPLREPSSKVQPGSAVC